MKLCVIRHPIVGLLGVKCFLQKVDTSRSTVLSVPFISSVQLKYRLCPEDTTEVSRDSGLSFQILRLVGYFL